MNIMEQISKQRDTIYRSDRGNPPTELIISTSKAFALVDESLGGQARITAAVDEKLQKISITRDEKLLREYFSDTTLYGMKVIVSDLVVR